MPGSEFRNSSFVKAEIKDSHFECSTFYNANLKKVNVSLSHFEFANFTRTSLCESYLKRNHFEGSEFDFSNMENVFVADSEFKGTRFKLTNIRGAWFNEASVGSLEELSDNCIINENTKHVLLTKKSMTVFERCSFLPTYLDLININDILKFITSIFTLLKRNILFNRYTREDAWIGFLEQSRIGNLFFNRWFYADFRGVEIEKADTSDAKELRRYVEDQQFLVDFKRQHNAIYHFWNITTACGWSAIRVAFWSLLVILGFAWLYANAPFDIPAWLNWLVPDWFCIDEKLIDPDLVGKTYANLPKFWKWSFVSFDIFSNLGIRNTHPQNWLGVVAVFFETVAGFTSLGLLISVLTNKYARRS